MTQLLEKRKKEKRRGCRQKTRWVLWSPPKSPQLWDIGVGKDRLPCKPLWPGTSSPDPGVGTCVSASDTCPGKACDPWQHQKQKNRTGVGGAENQKGGGRGGEETEKEKKKKKKNQKPKKPHEPKK